MNIYDQVTTENINVGEETKHKKRIFYFLNISMLILGIFSSLPVNMTYLTNAYSYLIYPIFVGCAYFWCMIDKEAIGKILNPFWFAWLLLFLPISLPIYLISNKGLKSGLVYTVKSYLTIILASIFFIIGGSVTRNILST